MSNIKTYSVKADGNAKLSANFSVREFRSPDSDTVKIDLDLVTLLQKIRDHFGAAITINSGYRTLAHNAKVGGVTNSYHTKGQAADIVVKGVSAKRVAQYAEAIGALGIGWYETQKFTHIDTRTAKYFWKDKSANSRATFSDCPYSEPTANLKQGNSGAGVKWLQWHLAKLGYSHITIDGAFGNQTKLAVKDFQSKCGLISDGICGGKTRAAFKMEVV